MKRDAIQSSQWVDKSNLELLDQVFSEHENQTKKSIDLNDLVGNPKFSEKRNVWVVFAPCHPDVVANLLTKITTCSRIVLLEPGDVPKGMLSAKDKQRLAKQFASGRVSLVVGGELEQRIKTLAANLDMDIYDAWKPVVSSGFMRENLPVVKQMIRLMQTEVSNRALEKTTQLKIPVQFLRNALINAPLMSQANPLSELSDSHFGRPILIVSAGPSLNKQLALLQQHQDLFTILAVDTVWPILSRAGITPDVLVALDPTNPPLWPINGLDAKTMLLADIGCHPGLASSHANATVFTSSMPQLKACIDVLGGQSTALRTGGSVATSAFNFARLLGGNPIVFIGQDLALTDGKDHAEGYPDTYHEDRLQWVQAQAIEVDGYHGGVVKAERQLLFYKNWFESEIAQIKDALIINSTEGGARIRGTLQIPFAAVCAEIQSTSLRKPATRIAHGAGLELIHLGKLQKNIGELIETIKRFKATAEEGQRIIRNKKNVATTKVLQRIDLINSTIRQFDVNAKYIVSQFGAVPLDQVRVKVVRRTDMKTIDHAIEKYDDIYSTSISSSGAALSFLHRIEVFYKKLAERGKYQPELLDEVLK